LTVRRPLLAAIVIAGLLAGGTFASVRALGGDNLPQRQLINQGRPANAPGATLQLVRVTIPAGGVITTHTHPGMQIIYIESGSISYTVVKGRIKVRRAASAGGAGPTEIVEAGETVTIGEGDTFIETKGMVHSVVNPSDVPAVILASSLFPADEPANIPVGNR
jgi:quercetin dioxygenase-like cupin family protein